MKRHPSLIPLSHDHHHGLVLAQRLKLGRSKAPSSDWPEDRESQRDRTVAFYHSELTHHFQQEEELIFPLAQKYLAEGDELVETLLEEHRRLAGYTRDMQVEGADLEEILVAFGTLLEIHIRLEERVLFEQLQEHAPESVLQEVGRKLRSGRE